jgi:hypothetical protein
MAFIEQGYAFVRLWDCRKKTTEVRLRVAPIEVAAWDTAIDGPTREATAVGELLAAFEGMTSAVVLARGVTLEEVDDAPVALDPEDAVYHFDKFGIGYKDGLRNYTLTIPSRDDAALNVSSDGVTGIIAGAGATAATIELVAQIEAAMIGAAGGTPDVLYVDVVR